MIIGVTIWFENGSSIEFEDVVGFDISQGRLSFSYVNHPMSGIRRNAEFDGESIAGYSTLNTNDIPYPFEEEENENE